MTPKRNLQCMYQKWVFFLEKIWHYIAIFRSISITNKWWFSVSKNNPSLFKKDMRWVFCFCIHTEPDYGRLLSTTVGSGLMVMMHVFSPSRNFCWEWPCPCNQVKITIVGVDVDELIKERERNKQANNLVPSQSSDSLQVTLQGLMSSTYLGICFDLTTVMYFICRVITNSNK